VHHDHTIKYACQETITVLYTIGSVL